jgi:hypothetical protein
MSNIRLDVYTAHYTKHEPTNLIAHSLLVDQDGAVKLIKQTSNTMTYMQIRLDELCKLFERIEKAIEPAINSYESMVVTVYGCNSNFNKLAVKLASVYRDLQPLASSCGVVDLLNLKLRRRDRSYYIHQNLLVRLMSSLLRLSTKVQLQVKFKPAGTNTPQMVTVLQAAELAYSQITTHNTNAIPLNSAN